MRAMFNTAIFVSKSVIFCYFEKNIISGVYNWQNEILSIQALYRFQTPHFEMYWKKIEQWKVSAESNTCKRLGEYKTSHAFGIFF